jgi:hypothetical protein
MLMAELAEGSGVFKTSIRRTLHFDRELALKVVPEGLTDSVLAKDRVKRKTQAQKAEPGAPRSIPEGYARATRRGR